MACKRGWGLPRRRAYCIGGALGFTLGFEDGFPTTDDVAMYLEMATGLSTEDAAGYAEDITTFNDMAAFGQAWLTLDIALRYAD